MPVLSGRKCRRLTVISVLRRALRYTEKREDTICPSTVAHAAPATPMSRTKM